MIPTDPGFLKQLEAAGLGGLVEHARAQKEQATETARRAAGERLTAAEREWADRTVKIDAGLAKAQSEADAIAQQLAAARRRCEVLEAERQQFATRQRREIDAATAELRANLPAAITEAREKLEALKDALRTESVRTETDLNTPDGNPRIIATNQHAIQRRKDAVQRALWTLHEMSGTYVPAEQLTAKIDAVLATIPNGLDAATPVERIPPKPAKRAA